MIGMCVSNSMRVRPSFCNYFGLNNDMNSNNQMIYYLPQPTNGIQKCGTKNITKMYA